MDLTKLSQNDKLALLAGAVVAITGLISVVNNWGVFMLLSVVAGVVAVFVIVQPQIAPATKLPVTKGLGLLGTGLTATVATGLTAVDWIRWILEHIASFDTVQFVVGLVFAIVLLWAGWTAFKAERGAPVPPTPAAPPAAS